MLAQSDATLLRAGALALLAKQEADTCNPVTAHRAQPRRKRHLNSLIDVLHPYAEMLSDDVDADAGGEQKRRRDVCERVAAASTGGRRPRRSCSTAVNYAETEHRYSFLQGKQARHTTATQLLATFESSTLPQPSFVERKTELAGADAPTDLVHLAIGVHAAAAAVPGERKAALPEHAETSALEAPEPYAAVRSTVASLLRSGRLRRSLATAERCSTSDTEATLRMVVLNTLQVAPEESGTPWALAPWEVDERRFVSARRFVWKGVTPLTLPRRAGAALVGCRVGCWWNGDTAFRAARVLRYCAKLGSSALCAAGTHVVRYEASGLLVAENLELPGEPLCWKILEEEGSSSTNLVSSDLVSAGTNSGRSTTHGGSSRIGTGMRHATASTFHGAVRPPKKSRRVQEREERQLAQMIRGQRQQPDAEARKGTRKAQYAREGGGAATAVLRQDAPVDMYGGEEELEVEAVEIVEGACDNLLEEALEETLQETLEEALEEAQEVMVVDTANGDSARGGGWAEGCAIEGGQMIAETAGGGGEMVMDSDGTVGAWAFRARVEALMSMQAQPKSLSPPPPPPPPPPPTPPAKRVAFCQELPRARPVKSKHVHLLSSVVSW